MVKLHCDRCGEEIKDKYYTFNFYVYDVYPRDDRVYDCCDSASFGSYTRDSALQVLNSQKMYCEKCKNEIDLFISKNQED